MNTLSKAAGVVQRACDELVWRRCNISSVLASGVNLRVRSRSEWEIFSEVFVDREYDEAILLALASPVGRPARIVDLGANVGFFGLRCLDLSRVSKDSTAFELVAVEGVRRVFDELMRRCQSNDFSPSRASLYHGLVGERKGSSYIYDGSFSCVNSVVQQGANRSRFSFRDAHAVLSEYLDLDVLIDWDGPIDLIKCDIEGSEVAFLQNYPALIQRARYLAIEVHPQQCSLEGCLDQIKRLGFTLRRTVRQKPTAVHYLAERLAPS